MKVTALVQPPLLGKLTLLPILVILKSAKHAETSLVPFSDIPLEQKTRHFFLS